MATGALTKSGKAGLAGGVAYHRDMTQHILTPIRSRRAIALSAAAAAMLATMAPLVPAPVTLEAPSRTMFSA